MRHGRARRLLTSLPDGLLDPATEAAVRAHAARCARCGDALADLDAADAWLRRLPLALVPVEPSPAAEMRLAALARWSRPLAGARPPVAEPGPRPVAPIARGARWGIPAVGAAAAAACLAAVLVSVAPVPDRAPADEGDEAFNFVLASDFSPGDRARSVRQVASTRVFRPASFQNQESDAYYMPIGVR